MPYKIEKPYQRLPREKSRRVKISLAEHAAIKFSYHLGGMKIRELARHYGVDKRLIQFILFPERKEKNLADRAARGGSKKYYNRIKNNSAVRACRRHRYKILT